jgi:hypothetical protein
VIDPAGYMSGAALLAAIDAADETEIAGGWNAIDSSLVTLDGTPKVVLSYQIRNIPKSSDLNADGFVDLHDALVALTLFNTPVDPSPAQPVPPGPNRNREITFDPALFPNSTAMLKKIDETMEKEISEAYDPQDSSLLNLDGMPKLAYSSERSLRKHRADFNSDNIIDLHDVVIDLNHFGEVSPSMFKQVQVNPSGSSTADQLILATDPVMEGQIALGFDVLDSERVTLDGNSQILWSLQRKAITQSYDLSGDEFVDIRDALICLGLFNTTP